LTTLDRLLESAGVSRVDPIKMDVQGAETHAPAGMERTPLANPAILVILQLFPTRIPAAGGDPESPLPRTTALGFKSYALPGRGAMRPVKDPTALIRHLTGRRYTNLVFSRAEIPSSNG